MIEPIDDFVQEPRDEELLSDRRRYSTGEKIKHFVLAELAGSRAVAALHVVGQDLQAGHGVRLGVVA